jgi:hypothetical protein
MAQLPSGAGILLVQLEFGQGTGKEEQGAVYRTGEEKDTDGAMYFF